MLDFFTASTEEKRKGFTRLKNKYPKYTPKKFRKSSFSLFVDSSVRCSAHIQPYFFISIGKVKTCDSKSAGSVARQYIQAMEYVSFETTRNCLNFVALSVIRTLK